MNRITTISLSVLCSVSQVLYDVYVYMYVYDAAVYVIVYDMYTESRWSPGVLYVFRKCLGTGEVS